MSYFDQCKVKFLNITGGDIPDSEYFKIDAISNSKLKLIDPEQDGSPEKYLEGFKSFYDPSLALGTAIHALYLTPKEFELSKYKGKPSGKCGYFIDLVWECRKKGLPLYRAIEIASVKADYYAGKLTPKLLRKAISVGLDYYLKRCNNYFTSMNKEVIVLPEKQLETINKCMRSLKNNQQANKIFAQNICEDKQIYSEFALISDILVTLPDGTEIPMKIKGKADSIVVDPETNTIIINDLKTTSKSIDYFMDAVIDNQAYNGVFSHHRYAHQCALYTFLIQQFADYQWYLGNYDLKFNMIVVETTGDNKAGVFPVSNAYIQYGIKKIKELIVRAAYVKQYGTRELIEC